MDPRCGEPRGYTAHRRRGEHACEACKAAIREYMREYRYRTGRVKQRLTPVDGAR